MAGDRAAERQGTGCRSPGAATVSRDDARTLDEVTRDRTRCPDRGIRERSPTTRHASALLGGVYAFTAYLLWGFLPLYFLRWRPTGPWELVAWRILLSLGFCAILLTVMRGWGRLGRDHAPAAAARCWTALAGALIYVNWQVFILAALTGHVIETSLGYFINPIVTVLLGVLVLRERLRVTQWIALGLAALAVGRHHRRLRRVPVDRADPRASRSASTAS